MTDATTNERLGRVENDVAEMRETIGRLVDLIPARELVARLLTIAETLDDATREGERLYGEMMEQLPDDSTDAYEAAHRARGIDEVDRVLEVFRAWIHRVVGGSEPSVEPEASMTAAELRAEFARG